MAYLDKDAFAALTVMPEEYVAQIEMVSPGWVDGQLEYWSRQIDSRLAKRYAVPFSSPYPVAVCGWLARIVTVKCFLKRGVDPQDEQFDEYKSDAAAAMDEIKEAANSETGLFELPLRADKNASGISRGGTFGYSETSPYVWADIQGRVGHAEDRNGGGSYG